MRISSWRIASASRRSVQALLRRLAADDADREAGARERLAPHEALGQAELGADRADLVLEQRPQRLDELELQVLGQAADVVVGLDRRRAGAAAGLDDVGVQRPLHEELRVAELRRLLLEDADELGADRLALGLRVGDARRAGRRKRSSASTATSGTLKWSRKAEMTCSPSFLRISPWSTNTHVSWSPIARWTSSAATLRVDAAGQAADDLAVADLRADARDLLLDDRRGAPGACRSRRCPRGTS